MITQTGITGTSLPGIQGAKGGCSRQTFYGSKEVTPAELRKIHIEPDGGFATIPTGVTPRAGDYILYTKGKSCIIYDIKNVEQMNDSEDYSADCKILNRWIIESETEEEINFTVNIDIKSVSEASRIKNPGILPTDLWYTPDGMNGYYPLKTSEAYVPENTIFNIYFWSPYTLSDDVKFVLEFIDLGAHPKMYSSLIYRYNVYGPSRDSSTYNCMIPPKLTFRGALEGYRILTPNSAFYYGKYKIPVLEYSDPSIINVPSNYSFEKLDNFTITVKDFDETIEGNVLFNKNVYMPASLLSRRKFQMSGTGDSTNYRIYLVAYVKESDHITRKILVDNLTSKLKNLMHII